MNFDTTLAIIPARKGSKRLPHKNTLTVDGIPLVQRTIITAKSAGLTKIAVTTNDPKVKEIALKEDVVVIDRPEELATDDAKTEDAILHAMNYVEKNLYWDFNSICLLQVTSPLLKPETLKNALELFSNKKLTSLIAVDSSSYKPCGAFYLSDKEVFKEKKTFWIEDLAIFVVDKEETIDIDYTWNWSIANAINKKYIYYKN